MHKGANRLTDSDMSKSAECNMQNLQCAWNKAIRSQHAGTTSDSVQNNMTMNWDKEFVSWKVCCSLVWWWWVKNGNLQLPCFMNSWSRKVRSSPRYLHMNFCFVVLPTLWKVSWQPLSRRARILCWQSYVMCGWETKRHKLYIKPQVQLMMCHLTCQDPAPVVRTLFSRLGECFL